MKSQHPNFNVKRIYKVYKGMKERCSNPNHLSYHNYGGKGVKVIVSKHDFIEWYLDNVTEDIVRPNVDRIDSNGHYELSNMQVISARENALKMLQDNPRWDVKLENMRLANEKNSKPVYIDGVKYASIREAERETRFSSTQIRRVKLVFCTDRLISNPEGRPALLPEGRIE